MRNTVMTGPIILSKEDSSRLRQNILHPTVEYLQEQERYFEEIASSMIIHKEGSNTRVEFKDLDLSNLDLMFEKEKNAAPVQVLMRASAYISLTSKASFINMHKAILNKAVYVHEMIDISETGYSYKKAQKDTELPENNLTEAA